jgi:RNA-directed DNA polymerase
MRLVESFNYLKIEQTEIGHTLLPIMNRPPGLNFLNFAISQKYEISHPNLVKKNFNSSSFFRKQSVDKLHGFHTFSTIINPSSLAIKTHMNELKEIVKTFSSQTQENLIYKLTPKIRHWSNYFKIITTKKNYFLCDFFLLKLLWRWACRRHPKKSRQWIHQKYFHNIQEKKWQFAFFKKENNSFICLPQHSETLLIKYKKKSDEKSAYD